MEGFHSRSGTVEDLVSNSSEENSSAYNERKIQRWKIQNRLKAIENIIIRSDICLSGVSDDRSGEGKWGRRCNDREFVQCDEGL